MTDIDRYRFFRSFAGGIVGQAAVGALCLARAEELLHRALELGVASVVWEYDPEPWDEGTEISAEEAREKFASNEWTGPFYCVVQVGDDDERSDNPCSALASLSGIVVGPRGTDEPYCRVVVAELATELADDLRQAIGDALDERHSCAV